eukprot:TRINITY_DN12145_c0_g5_i5.p1 TRINITY_DN12145_c0_g5~~TRINITY_DN12145_c0_g5_i5.p1  ORF type:complete len:205 (-),score=32.39 TRINITY_DN12145_c0_g5_i5:42-656(-)
MENIIQGAIKPVAGISEDAKELIEKLLNTNPKKRPSLEEIVNSPWVKRVYPTLAAKYSLLKQVNCHEGLKKSVSVPVKHLISKIPSKKIEETESHPDEVSEISYKQIARHVSATNNTTQACQIHNFLSEDFASEETSFIFPSYQIRESASQEEEKTGADAAEEIPRELLYCYPSDSSEWLPAAQSNVKVVRVKARSNTTLRHND